MSEASLHAGVEALLPGAALEILDGEDLARVQSHIHTCAQCKRLLDRYRQVVAAMALGLPSQVPDLARYQRLRRRLLDRARGTSMAAAPRPPPPGDRRPAREKGALTRWTGWAVAAGLAGLLVVHDPIHRPLAYGWLAAGLLAIVVLALAVYAVRQRRRLSSLQDRLTRAREGRHDH